MIGWYIALVLHLLGSLQMILFVADLCKRDEHWQAMEKAHKNKTHMLTAVIGSFFALFWPITTLVLWEHMITKDDSRKD